MEQPSNSSSEQYDYDRVSGYIQKAGIEPPARGDSEALDVAVIAAKRVMRRVHAGLPSDASDEDLEAAMAAKEELDIRRRLGLPDDASGEQVRVWQEIDDKARRRIESKDEFRRLTLRASSQANSTNEEAEAARKELELFTRRALNLPDDATDEAVKAAEKARNLTNSGLYKRRLAGLPDDASDDELRATRVQLRGSPMDREAQKAFDIRASMDLPADTPDDIVQATMDAWDRHRLFIVN